MLITRFHSIVLSRARARTMALQSSTGNGLNVSVSMRVCVWVRGWDDCERRSERRNNMRQQRYRRDPWLRYIILALTLSYKEYRQGGAADITLVVGRLVGNILFFLFLIYSIYFPPSYIFQRTHNTWHVIILYYIIYLFFLEDKNRSDLSSSSIHRDCKTRSRVRVRITEKKTDASLYIIISYYYYYTLYGYTRRFSLRPAREYLLFLIMLSKRVCTNTFTQGNPKKKSNLYSKGEWWTERMFFATIPLLLLLLLYYMHISYVV